MASFSLKDPEFLSVTYMMSNVRNRFSIFDLGLNTNIFCVDYIRSNTDGVTYLLAGVLSAHVLNSMCR